MPEHDPNTPGGFSAMLREQVEASHERDDDTETAAEVIHELGAITVDKLMNPEEYGFTSPSIADGLTFGSEPEPVPLEEVDLSTLRTEEEHREYARAVRESLESDPELLEQLEAVRAREASDQAELDGLRQHQLDLNALVALEESEEDDATLLYHWRSMSPRAREAAVSEYFVSPEDASRLDLLLSALREQAEHEHAVAGLTELRDTNIARADEGVAELVHSWEPAEVRARLEAADALMLSQGVNFDELKQRDPQVALIQLAVADAALQERDHLERTHDLQQRILSHDPTISAGYEINGQPVLKRELPVPRVTPAGVDARVFTGPKRESAAEALAGIAAVFAEEEDRKEAIIAAHTHGTDALLRHRLEQAEARARSRGLLR